MADHYLLSLIQYVGDGFRQEALTIGFVLWHHDHGVVGRDTVTRLDRVARAFQVPVPQVRNEVQNFTRWLTSRAREWPLIGLTGWAEEDTGPIRLSSPTVFFPTLDLKSELENLTDLYCTTVQIHQQRRARSNWLTHLESALTSDRFAGKIVRNRRFPIYPNRLGSMFQPDFTFFSSGWNFVQTRTLDGDTLDLFGAIGRTVMLGSEIARFPDRSGRKRHLIAVLDFPNENLRDEFELSFCQELVAHQVQPVVAEEVHALLRDIEGTAQELPSAA